MTAWILVAACVAVAAMLFAWIAVDVSAYFRESARLRRLDAELARAERRRLRIEARRRG